MCSAGFALLIPPRQKFSFPKNTNFWQGVSEWNKSYSWKKLLFDTWIISAGLSPFSPSSNGVLELQAKIQSQSYHNKSSASNSSFQTQSPLKIHQQILLLTSLQGSGKLCHSKDISDIPICNCLLSGGEAKVSKHKLSELAVSVWKF